MNSILYVTTSHLKMYDFSGKRLIESFSDTKQQSKLLYLTENFNIDNCPPCVIEQQLDNYPFFTNWLNSNSDIIPTKFGGKDTSLKQGSFNYKASLFFRKIAALHYAYSNYNMHYDTIIWIDNDCVLKKRFDEHFINFLFNNKDVFYYLGEKRLKNAGVESGFMGFKHVNGYGFLNKLFTHFEDGSFRKCYRWDDGWVMKELVSKSIVCNDVANESHKSDVLRECKETYKYLIHKKGSHWRNVIDNCGHRPS